MRKQIYSFSDLEIYEVVNQFIVRYDAGAHQVVTREDEITEDEVLRIRSGREGMTEVLVALQKRLIERGLDPYVSNCP